MDQVPTEESLERSVKRLTSILLGTTFFWQVWVVSFAYRSAEAYLSLYAGLGVNLPGLTIWYFAVYRLMIILPIGTLLLAIAVRAKNDVSLRLATNAVVFGLLLGFIIQAFTTEALSAPMFTLISQIG